MKKYLSMLSVIVFSFLIFAPASVSAVSGACSYHNGVNCSAGASYTGNVQCNDGWVNSSVYFSDTQECKVDSCPAIVYGLTCNTEADYTRVQQEVNSMRGEQNAINARRGLTGSSFDTSSTVGQDKLDSCREAIGLYNRMVTSRNQCLDNAEKLSAQMLVYSNYQRQSNLDALCIKFNGTGSVWDNSLPDDTDGTKCNPTKSQRNRECEKMDPKMFWYSTTESCTCPYGEIINKDSKCENEETYYFKWCQANVGEGSRYVGGLCRTCPAGYVFELNNTCVLNAPAVATSTPKLNIKNIPKGSYTPVTQPVTLTRTPTKESPDEATKTVTAQVKVLTPILNTTSTTSTQTKQEPQKHWYQWLNPFSWFK